MSATNVIMYGNLFDTTANFPKEIKSKIITTITKLTNTPDLNGLNLEKLSNDLYSIRVDDNYRIICAKNEDHIALLYVNTHEKAYHWADTHHGSMNTDLGFFYVDKVLTPQVKEDSVSKVKLSRLSNLWDKHLLEMRIPEEYWPQLRTQVFTKEQLSGFKELISEQAYITLEYILEDANVDDAMKFYESLTNDVQPALIKERVPYYKQYTPEELMSIGVPFHILKLLNLLAQKLNFNILQKNFRRLLFKHYMHCIMEILLKKLKTQSLKLARKSKLQTMMVFSIVLSHYLSLLKLKI